jgi:hypothetical protein
MTNLSDKAIKIISDIIECMRQDNAELDDIESLTDLLKGEFEENHPDMKISRSDIKKYLLEIL